MKRWISMSLIVSLMGFGALACDSGGGDSGPGEDTTPPLEDTLAVDTPEGIDITVDVPGEDTPPPADTVEAETYATPEPNKVTAEHTGWEEAKCWDCHEADVHNDGLDPYLCADCHGTNGAPGGHSDSNNCAGCHGAEHGDVGFPDPLSCKTCHPT
jgi:hypothetical protein